jgi:DMSO/TMAO reductase YedYZ molybdopterin-dependent catalytic subunit
MRTGFIVDAWKLGVSSDRDPPGRTMTFDLAMIRAMPRTETTALFMCIEGWSDPWRYAGVRFSDFMRFAGVGTRTGKPWKPEDSFTKADLYRYVGLSTPDREYYVSIDMESMLHSQTVLAYEMNERPLELIHGAPLRLVIPVKYGTKSIKRIGSIVFSDQRPPDLPSEHGDDWYAGL